MAYTNSKSSSNQGGSPLLGMIILGFAYFAITHPDMLGLHLGNLNKAAVYDNTSTASTAKTGTASAKVADRGTDKTLKGKATQMVANPLNGTGSAAIVHVMSNVAGTKLNPQTTVYSAKGDAASRMVRPNVAPADYYQEAKIAPEEDAPLKPADVAKKLAF